MHQAKVEAAKAILKTITLGRDGVGKETTSRDAKMSWKANLQGACPEYVLAFNAGSQSFDVPRFSEIFRLFVPPSPNSTFTDFSALR